MRAPLMLFASALLLSGTVLFADAKTPFMSAEVKFADSSPSGLQIMPASCASVEHWQGECSMPTSCIITVTPNSYTSGTVSTVSVHWEAPQPSPANDSQIVRRIFEISGIGAVFGSGTLNAAAPQSSFTYKFDGAYLDTYGTLLDSFTCSAPVTVSNAQPNTLYINQVELYRASGEAVSPGDRITYRMFVSNTGNQNWINVRDIIPANTTLVWQGGGTNCVSLGDSCNSQSAAGYSGELWWQQQYAADGTQLYVDFTVQINSDAPNGAQICNTGQTYSQEVGALSNPVLSNEICNPVSVPPIPCPTSQPWARNTDSSNTYTEGHEVKAYDVDGKRIEESTNPPICVRNSSSRNYFVPIRVGDIDAFKSAVNANTVPGVYYEPI